MRLTIRARLIQLALIAGIDPMHAIDDTLARDFAAMLRRRCVS